MVEKLLNIEYFFTENSFKSKLKNIGQFGHTLDFVGKTFIDD
jgi:hypothetical protein